MIKERYGIRIVFRYRQNFYTTILDLPRIEALKFYEFGELSFADRKAEEELKDLIAKKLL